jgi:hypothetical protein
MSISNDKPFSPYETKIVHTTTTCGISIRAVSQKGKSEHGNNITVRFADIKNPNHANVDNLIGLLEKIQSPNKEIKAFQTSNDINYPHPPKLNNSVSISSNANNEPSKVLLSPNESKPEKCKSKELDKLSVSTNAPAIQENIAFPMDKENIAVVKKL